MKVKNQNPKLNAIHNQNHNQTTAQFSKTVGVKIISQNSNTKNVLGQSLQKEGFNTLK